MTSSSSKTFFLNATPSFWRRARSRVNCRINHGRHKQIINQGVDLKIEAQFAGLFIKAKKEKTRFIHLYCPMSQGPKKSTKKFHTNVLRYTTIVTFLLHPPTDSAASIFHTQFVKKKFFNRITTTDTKKNREP